GIGNLARAGLAAKLREHLGGLRDTRGPERMAAADQPAPRVHYHVAAVVASPGRDERPGLALPAEAQLLVRDHLGDREAVVDLGHVHAARPAPRHAVRALRGALERGPAGVVLVQRGQLEAVERLAGAANPHGPVG